MSSFEFYLTITVPAAVIAGIAALYFRRRQHRGDE